eukprot:TRINITY_DN11065_c1_g1_i1.p1 TRINITY_DN11065_c1_g1~~TRINITY_DN11065_c1_g1_i1.p1  ORF type:complete len:405 (+),score=96.94 TRINITY_DN11065_c1_g1_i1:168-1382(+)
MAHVVPPTRGVFLGKGLGKKGGFGDRGFVEEDRSQDWYCISCRERNFAKRTECYKCGAARPKEGEGPPPRAQLPPAGSTINGMVKSYNKKGFGFIMVFGVEDQDIYYTREHVSPRLLHPDMPGEQVTFELFREGGRPVARNIRPIGEPKGGAPPSASGGKGGHMFAKGSSREEEDRSRDWSCTSCGERNFMKRLDCFKCRAPRAACFSESARDGRAADQSSSNKPQRRTFSPHAGSRAVREALAGEAAARRGAAKSGSDSDAGSGESRRRKKPRGKKRKRKSSSSGSSSSSSSRSRKKKAKKGKRSRSGSSKSSSGSSCQMEEPSSAASALQGQGSGNPEIDKAKSEALEALLRLKEVQPKEVRMTEWRALLRQWHPDKNPERIEVATAVFQFLQKGKPMLDSL